MIRKETFELISKECAYCCHKTNTPFEGDKWYCCYFKDDVECTFENCRHIEFADRKMENYPTDPEAFANVMHDIYEKYWVQEGDEEDVHWFMDKEIMNLLRALGYHEAVYIFEETKKWYS